MRASLHTRSFPLRRPFRSSGWEISSRDVLLLQLTDDTGNSGWGEAAPLPAFGTETFADAARILREITSSAYLTATDAEETLAELDAAFPTLSGAPTARFALESALRDLRARQENIRLSRALGGDSARARIPVNAVAGGGTAEEAARAALDAVQEGYRCIKMKVGAADPEEDVARIRAVRAVMAPDMTLRLDANGAWDFGTAEEAMRLFQPYGIEYIEQPVPAEDVDELAALTGLGIMPVAADEAAQNLARARELMERGAADLLVIKPMAAGGLAAVRDFTIEVHAAGMDVVLTSFVDSAVGRAAVAQLCASLPFPLRAQGLSTGTLFAQDSARDRIAGGQMLLPGGAGIGFTPDIGDST